MAETSDELIPTRATLLQRLKDWGDESSWQDFFNTYWKLIYGVAMKGGLNPNEAEEVVQETMICVAKKMPGFKYDPDMGSFKGWLLNTTRWRITDQLRKRNRHESADCGGEDEVDSPKGVPELSSDLETLWNQEWEQTILQAAMTKARRQLDPQHYQIFDCCIHKNWKPEKVAKMFDVPVSQVYTVKHRVAELIRQEVERLGKEMI